MKSIELSPDEVSYLLRMLKEHREYYQTLAAYGKATMHSRTKLAFLEGLWMKLVK